MEDDIREMLSEFSGLALRDGSGFADAAPGIFRDAARVLFFLGADAPPAPEVLILAETRAQAQAFAAWLVLSPTARRLLGRVRPGAGGVTRTDAGSIRIALRADFTGNWTGPMALIPADAAEDDSSGAAESPGIALPDIWDVALLRKGVA